VPVVERDLEQPVRKGLDDLSLQLDLLLFLGDVAPFETARTPFGVRASRFASTKRLS
jgi:hypothetical protein